MHLGQMTALVYKYVVRDLMRIILDLLRDVAFVHSTILSLRFFGRSQPPILRTSDSTFRLPALDRARYRFHPPLLVGFGKHAERYLHHILGGIRPKSILAARHTV
jgi:hypothetical protein